VENNVKKYRLLADMTQQDLADKAGLTRQTLSLIEKGEYNPSLKLCLAICWTLHKTLDEIFWIEEEALDE
jgi:putative transcriptional regulator